MARLTWLTLVLLCCACGSSSKGDRRAFLIAAESGDDRVVREQLAAGVAPDDVFQINDRTALCLAAINGQAGIVELLLEKGADPHTEHLGLSLKADVMTMRGHIRVAHADPASTDVYKKQDGTTVELKTMRLNEQDYEKVLKLIDDALARSSSK